MAMVEIIIGKEDEFPKRVKKQYHLDDAAIECVPTDSEYFAIYRFTIEKDTTKKDLHFFDGLIEVLTYAWSMPRYFEINRKSLPKELR